MYERLHKMRCAFLTVLGHLVINSHDTNDVEIRIQTIRKYIQTDYTNEARSELLDLIDDHFETLPPHLRHAVSITSADFHRWRRLNNMGQRDPELLSHVNYRILELADQVSEALNRQRAPAQFLSAGNRPEAPENIVHTPPLQSSRIPAVSAPHNAVPAPHNAVPAPHNDGRQKNAVRVRASAISKHYSSTTFVLKPLSFELRAGKITGVVGMNGSGKSTLLKILLGDLAPSAGAIEYNFGEQRLTSWRQIKARIGYVAQRPPKWNGKVREVLEYIAATFDIRGTANSARVDWLLNRYGLTEYQEHTWGELSGGYQLRFDLARAVLHRPSLLILDEPLANLDVVTQQEFLFDLRKLARSKVSPAAIIITSQHLFEIEAIAHQLIVLRDGQEIFNNDINSLSNNIINSFFEVTANASEMDIEKVLMPLNIRYIRRKTTNYIISLPANVGAADVLRALVNSGIDILYFRDITHSVRPFLEEDAGTQVNQQV